jgi:predicted DNA-binding protein (MmcQ/YjbR family)
MSSATDSTSNSGGDRHPFRPVAEDIMRPLRAICLRFPEAVEAVTFGSPTFKVRAKHFAMVHQPGDRIAVWCKAPPGVQEAYVRSEPERYYVPPYVGPKGWVAAWIDAAAHPDWDEIAAIVEESYRLVAPKRLVARMDGPPA